MPCTKCVRQWDRNGQLGTRSSDRLRYVPLTQRLTAALVEHWHLRSIRVLCQTDGSPFTRQIVQNRMLLAARLGERKEGAGATRGGVVPWVHPVYLKRTRNPAE